MYGTVKEQRTDRVKKEWDNGLRARGAPREENNQKRPCVRRESDSAGQYRGKRKNIMGTRMSRLRKCARGRTKRGGQNRDGRGFRHKNTLISESGTEMGGLNSLAVGWGQRTPTRCFNLTWGITFGKDRRALVLGQRHSEPNHRWC